MPANSAGLASTLRLAKERAYREFLRALCCCPVVIEFQLGVACAAACFQAIIDCVTGFTRTSFEGTNNFTTRLSQCLRHTSVSDSLAEGLLKWMKWIATTYTKLHGDEHMEIPSDMDANILIFWIQRYGSAGHECWHAAHLEQDMEAVGT